MLDTSAIKKDFPIFTRLINGKPLIYLDSTASSLKPQPVIDAMINYYSRFSANIFRGIYTISEEATAEYEDARKKIAGFIHAADTREVIFVRNATEAINLVAASWSRQHISSEDEIVITLMEHHANIVPWQQASKETGATLRFWEIDKTGILTDSIERQVTKKTKMLAIAHISNVLGTINPVKEIISQVRQINPSCLVLVDAAQSVPHRPVDVQDLGCDFLAFSGHKMLGPTGIGVLWGRYDLLCRMPPYQTGGEMIQIVTIEGATFKDPPHKFEAGTPHIAGAIGLGAATDYLSRIGMETVWEHEAATISYALDRMKRIPGIKIIGPDDPQQHAGVIAFTLADVHPHDLADIANRDNICIRSGSHCAMPLHSYLQLTATARASFYVYTSLEDVDALIEGIEKARKIMKNVSS